ncbi:hypothetical protein NEPTK9_000266 [Candidatus Neptunochlamydia vexilliferae]|uniref:Transposase putative helix-turn-helix domain-containing protein n=1 Tax=Candidatus Neptunichlamydia vexilliferae TaxID=1651774 RepID=A0ABS0AXA0_9BACT|nr:hypothetical protein [Candidatus Neptunochlamydia vexilliferae]
MIIRKAFRFRINTNKELNQQLSEYVGCCRFLWNKALALNLSRLEEGYNATNRHRHNEKSFYGSRKKISSDYASDDVG